jgi:hypothetical protein
MHKKKPLTEISGFLFSRAAGERSSRTPDLLRGLDHQAQLGALGFNGDVVAVHRAAEPHCGDSASCSGAGNAMTNFTSLRGRAPLARVFLCSDFVIL